ncbi:MAG: prepilin peptidase [Thermodesulfovibrionales bacterium]|nr:prepilin peptidase [Thermodesulfovibrionales bacterium]
MGIYLIAALLGLIVGSFLNVCIHRVPREQSIIWPASRCPSCRMPIGPLDNIPVISYIFLKGRCRRCGARISLRYPLVESLNALLYAGVVYRFGLGWHAPFYLAFVSSLIVIAFIDLDFQIIPDGITLPGIPIGLVAGSFLLPDPFFRAGALGLKASLIGAAAGFCLFYLVAVLSRGGMGGGDIKLMAMIGGLTGWKSVLLTTFAGSLMGSLIGIFLMAFKGKGRKTKIPFGPFLAMGAVITLFWGQEILWMYLNVRR